MIKFNYKWFVLCVIAAVFTLATAAEAVMWTWVGGSDATDQNGVYGTKGKAASGNVPGARSCGLSWTDANSIMWLFGGWSYDAAGDSNYLNDLWKFDGSNWTWVSGSNAISQKGVYGTKGVAASDNVPGARGYGVSWIDAQDNLWLFGGYGYDVNGNEDFLNDLWKFDGSNWTWVSGSNAISQKGVYGTKGVAASGNVPGARPCGLSWIDAEGNLWLFGGYGYDVNSNDGYLNDLWKFDGSNWTWVSGSNAISQKGVYGTKGVPASGNVPGARGYSVSWIDAQDNLWLFGGYGYDVNGDEEFLNDLWKFDGSNWIWVSGSNAISQKGVYGTKGVTASGNVPGASACGLSWIDAEGNLWLFGGYGYDVNSNDGYLNDLWKFDGSNWTWVSGSNAISQKGVYGTKGVPASGNVPGARGYSVSWIDAQDNLWLFGGYGYSKSGEGELGDLWKVDMSVVVIAKCVVAAGKVQGQDNFSASGIIELPTTLDFNNVNHIDVNIVSSTGASIYPQTVDADVVNGKFQYKAKSRITSLAVDSKKGTFSITAKSIVLTGLSCPLWLKLTIGTDELSSITDESIVNGTKMLIPTRLMRTYDDKLVVNKAKAKLNSKKASSDTLSVTGDIAVIDTDVNLYNYDVNFVWGEEMFRVPSHSFKAAKTGHLYKCSKVVADASGNDGIVTAQLDLDKATFTLSVTGADDIDASSTSVSFGISFADFNETADVTLSTGRSW